LPQISIPRNGVADNDAIVPPAETVVEVENLQIEVFNGDSKIVVPEKVPGNPEKEVEYPDDPEEKTEVKIPDDISPEVSQNPEPGANVIKIFTAVTNLAK
jgi:hypothetical protein